MNRPALARHSTDGGAARLVKRSAGVAFAGAAVARMPKGGRPDLYRRRALAMRVADRVYPVEN